MRFVRLLMLRRSPTLANLSARFNFCPDLHQQQAKVMPSLVADGAYRVEQLPNQLGK